MIATYILYSVPSRPTIATVAPTTNSRLGFGLFISWKVPTSHCLITSYKVQFKMSSDTSWSTPLVSVLPPKTYYNLIGLSSKTSYDVRVRAVSEAGKGEWSGVGQATTHGGTHNTSVLFHFELLQTPFP